MYVYGYTKLFFYFITMGNAIGNDERYCQIKQTKLKKYKDSVGLYFPPVQLSVAKETRNS